MRSSTKDLESISVCNQKANQKYPHCNSWTLKYDRSVKEGILSFRVECILKNAYQFSSTTRGELMDIPSMNFIPYFGRDFTPRIPIKMGSCFRRGTFRIRSHCDSRRNFGPARPARTRRDPYWRGSHRIEVQVP